MKLTEPSATWRSGFEEMAREYAAAGEHRYALAFRDFPGYLSRVETNRCGKAEERSPQLEFWLEGNTGASSKSQKAVRTLQDASAASVRNDVP
jgi:hypothetical protein